MAIKEHELEKMNAMLNRGSTISSIARKYPAYDYWEIYWAVGDYSFLGHKRKITNRVNSLAKSKNPRERAAFAKEVNELVTSMYSRLKANNKKLQGVAKALEK